MPALWPADDGPDEAAEFSRVGAVRVEQKFEATQEEFYIALTRRNHRLGERAS